MGATWYSIHSFADFWQVLALFLIPVGGGIPAGVLVARSKGIDWPAVMVIYLVSDIILACLFEPLFRIIMYFGRGVPFLVRLSEAFRLTVQKTVALYGNRTGPFALVMIAFGVDPMTGRAAAIAAGHGFVAGWMIAIAGDMIFFTVLMVSTLWLNSIVGDGTITALIIFGLMMGVPLVIRRVRERRHLQKLDQ